MIEVSKGLPFPSNQIRRERSGYARLTSKNVSNRPECITKSFYIYAKAFRQLELTLREYRDPTESCNNVILLDLGNTVISLPSHVGLNLAIEFQRNNRSKDAVKLSTFKLELQQNATV